MDTLADHCEQTCRAILFFWEEMLMDYMGIDISKYKHDAYVLSESGEILTDIFTFSNNADGFRKLEQVLNLYGQGNVRIGFESTGNYAINLKLFLEQIGFDFMEINPLLIHKHIKSNTLRQTVTDKISAFAIADYMRGKKYYPFRKGFYEVFALKQLTRFRSTLIKDRSKYLVHLTNILDCIFPEFKSIFDNEFTVTSLYILENYGSAQAISNMNSRSYDILRRKSRGHFTISMFVRLKQAAKNTVGMYEECYGIKLQSILSMYNNINEQVKVVEIHIEKMITEMNPYTLSIKGIGPISAAIIVAEFGDFSLFDNPDQLLAFAGMDPKYFQSGTSEHKGGMTKHGSPHLRNTLINCCRALRFHNEVFAAYYYKKRSEGKSEDVALVHMAKKLLRVIYFLETNGELFDPDKLR